MPAAVKLVKPHRHFGVTVPVCTKGRKMLGRWRPTQYRVFRPTEVSNNKMADALQMVDNKRTIPSQRKEGPRLVKRRFHTLPHFSPTVVFPSKFISYIHQPKSFVSRQGYHVVISIDIPVNRTGSTLEVWVVINRGSCAETPSSCILAVASVQLRVSDWRLRTEVSYRQEYRTRY